MIENTSGEAVLAEVEAILIYQKTNQVRSIATVEGEWGEHQQMLEQLRRASFTDYPDLLADKIKPDATIRG